MVEAEIRKAVSAYEQRIEAMNEEIGSLSAIVTESLRALAEIGVVFNYVESSQASAKVRLDDLCTQVNIIIENFYVDHRDHALMEGYRQYIESVTVTFNNEAEEPQEDRLRGYSGLRELLGDD